MKIEVLMKEISRFGALEKGGLTRLGFSEEDARAREFLLEKGKELGLELRIDEALNIYFTLKGEDEKLPPVALGSHIDSVVEGGFYDGTLGVISAFYVIENIKKAKIKLKRNLVIIVFSCEESSRFNIASVGSKLLCGKLDLEKTKILKDKDGISLYEAMTKMGAKLEKVELLKKDSFYAFLEVHIEQGRVLESKNIPLGIVQAIAAPIRYKLFLKGKADHSGATPMNLRFDALACASEIILKLEELAKAKKTAVATVGYIKANPNVLNVIAGECEIGIDLRDINEKDLEALEAQALAAIKELCQKRGISYESQLLGRDKPVLMSEKIIKLFEEEAKKKNYETLLLPSGAGHDTAFMKDIASYIGMLFIPCEDGISHNIKENINYEDAYKACEVLESVVIRLAQE